MLSVLQQQLETPLPLADDNEPAPRHIPENRVAAGRNHFAEPAPAREPATPRYSASAGTGSGSSGGSSGGGGRQAGPVGLMLNPDTKSSRAKFISN